MVALYPGGPRSSGPRGVGGAEVCDVAADVGVNVRSAGGGTEELKDEDDTERLDPAIAQMGLIAVPKGPLRDRSSGGDGND